MTPAEIDAILASAEAEFNSGESAMLIAPLALIGLIERLQGCERRLAAVESYDELHD